MTPTTLTALLDRYFTAAATMAMAFKDNKLVDQEPAKAVEAEILAAFDAQARELEARESGWTEAHKQRARADAAEARVRELEGELPEIERRFRFIHKNRVAADEGACSCGECSQCIAGEGLERVRALLTPTPPEGEPKRMHRDANGELVSDTPPTEPEKPQRPRAEAATEMRALVDKMRADLEERGESAEPVRPQGFEYLDYRAQHGAALERIAELKAQLAALKAAGPAVDTTLMHESARVQAELRADLERVTGERDHAIRERDEARAAASRATDERNAYRSQLTEERNKPTAPEGKTNCNTTICSCPVGFPEAEPEELEPYPPEEQLEDIAKIYDVAQLLTPPGEYSVADAVREAIELLEADLSTAEEQRDSLQRRLDGCVTPEQLEWALRNTETLENGVPVSSHAALRAALFDAPPCGGSRCEKHNGSWIHSSKSYGTCAARATEGGGP